MNKSQLPPNWSELVKDSHELVTDEQFNLAKQLALSIRRFRRRCIHSRPRPIIQQSSATATSEPIVNPTEHAMFPPIDSLANNSARLPVCEEYDVHSSTYDLEAHEMINLATSGLRRSQQIKSTMNPNNDGPTIMAYTSSINNKGIFNRPKRKIPILAFFSVFCAIGALWSVTASQSPHFHDKACHSYTSIVSNDYERINGLFDNTMNILCHQVKSYTTWNEAYIYKQMLQ